MANYLPIIEQHLKFEGGYVNHPSDKGGATNFGIAYNFHKDKFKSPDEVKNLTKAKAIEFYKRYYWNPLKLDKITNQGVAQVIFNWGAHAGLGACGYAIQRALNKCGYSLVVDGVVGAKTFNALNTVNPNSFIYEFIADNKKTLGVQISKDSSQSAFAKGWTKRYDDLLKLALSSAKIVVNPMLTVALVFMAYKVLVK
jgi:lysozyme family protein